LIDERINFMKRGFTLIELLCVVITIGILASVAMPQYNKQVNIARWAECIWIAGSLKLGQVLYRVEHDVYSTGNVAELPIDLPPLYARRFVFSIKTPFMIYGIYKGDSSTIIDNFLVPDKPYFYVNITSNTTGYGNGAPYALE
jgi:prepilin-type N-terminal cleavage/methylation domain-containing protein